MPHVANGADPRALIEWIKKRLRILEPKPNITLIDSTAVHNAGHLLIMASNNPGPLCQVGSTP